MYNSDQSIQMRGSEYYITYWNEYDKVIKKRIRECFGDNAKINSSLNELEQLKINKTIKRLMRS